MKITAQPSEKRVVKTIKIVAGKDEPVVTELLAKEIENVSAGMRRIASGRLTQEALVLLIAEESGVGRPAVRDVLNTLSRIDRVYLKGGMKS